MFYHNLERVTMRFYVVTLKNFVAFWVARKQWPLGGIRGYLDRMKCYKDIDFSNI